jgi:hypothetical protein
MWPGNVFVDSDAKFRVHRINPNRVPDPNEPGMAEYLAKRDPPLPVPARVATRPPIMSLLKPQKFIHGATSDTESDQDLPSTSSEETKVVPKRKQRPKPAQVLAAAAAPILSPSRGKDSTLGGKDSVLAPTAPITGPVTPEGYLRTPAVTTSPGAPMGKAPGPRKTRTKPISGPPATGATVPMFPSIQFSPETDEFYKGISRERGNSSRGSKRVEGLSPESIIKHLRYLRTIDNLVAANPGTCVFVKSSTGSLHFPLYCLRVALGWKAGSPEVTACIVRSVEEAARMLGEECGCSVHLEDASLCKTGAMTTIHKFAKSNVEVMIAKAQGVAITPLVCHIVEMEGVAPAPQTKPTVPVVPSVAAAVPVATPVLPPVLAAAVLEEAKTVAALPAAATPSSGLGQGSISTVPVMHVGVPPSSGGIPVVSSSSSSSAAIDGVDDKVLAMRKRSTAARAEAQIHQEAFLKLMSEHLVLEANILAYEQLKRPRL